MIFSHVLNLYIGWIHIYGSQLVIAHKLFSEVVNGIIFEIPTSVTLGKA